MPKLFETDDGGEFAENLYSSLIKNNNTKRYSGSTCSGDVFAGRFKEIKEIFIGELFFERRRQLG